MLNYEVASRQRSTRFVGQVDCGLCLPSTLEGEGDGCPVALPTEEEFREQYKDPWLAAVVTFASSRYMMLPISVRLNPSASQFPVHGEIIAIPPPVMSVKLVFNSLAKRTSAVKVLLTETAMLDIPSERCRHQT